MKIERLSIEQLFPDPNQPRKFFGELDEEELGSSLVEHKQLVPIIAVKVEAGYQIADGERRWRAAKRKGLTHLNAIVLETMPDSVELLTIQLAVNCLRADLKPLERTEAYQRFIQNGMRGSELAKRLSVSKGTVTRYLSHAHLSEPLKAMLQDGTLSSPKAYALSRMTPEQQQEAIQNLTSETLRDDLERKARKKKKNAGTKEAQLRNIRYELPHCTIAVRASKAMSVEAFIDVLSSLLRECRKAKTQQLDLGTMALVLRDQNRAAGQQAIGGDA